MHGLSNLPPGVTDADIERAALGDDADESERFHSILRDMRRDRAFRIADPVASDRLDMIHAAVEVLAEWLDRLEAEKERK